MNVYADHAATTPMRACAKEAMLEALGDPYTYYMTAEQYEQFTQSVNC